ncbi:MULTISPECIES: SDR family oxidoreductase [Streptomyces]|uniref:Short-chain dehydrogenase n=1 Tax=Streptomyces tsukubensis (strain DSM 42081 / NBRC 108919 / NRRL 18488 / 9993) TaxID=1114943 RepID=I2MX51_STRT9|nr:MULTISPECIES: SDR family oxidoreductase [Streptomyces]AZK93745.1 short-chain dehydrogenase [Streptomyces tsukubensis]EIF89348.1 short chain dehydrogenase [Streptomyces tsukubensis NRRL18488]MYS68515.1 SDR family NAD(P)-dependent oxidoreductase [Streptomyces sp. SID5473]QKM70115.1 short-chain dehydrogenase [Streptomyces tsukubensis NRRL18488]TAI45907.1 SDR family NAD(P)-dependent oxidoreductase [Streptomyces tsukubensis]
MTASTPKQQPLAGRIALVAGATRGAGRALAVALGAAGATVYATGRTIRDRVSELGRPGETIEQTAELVTAAGGEGIAVPTDHLDAEQVRRLVDRIDRDHGRLDVLVNDVWGGNPLLDFDTRMWDVDLERGLRMIDLGVRTHIITSSIALPLLVRRPGGLVVEVTDGTARTNRGYRENFYYDLAKNGPIRMAFLLGEELKHAGASATAVTPGFLRSEEMLDHFGLTEETWRDGIGTLPEHWALSESPAYLARGVAALAADPDRARFNGQSLDSGELAREYGITDTDGSRPDVWGFILAEQAGEKPDPAGYR